MPALGCAPVDLVVPFGKGAIVNMLGLPASTRAEGLDARIVDAARRHRLAPEQDAIIIAWDLEPPIKRRDRCAWREKVDVYQGIADSPLETLRGTAWARSAAERAQRLRQLQDVPPRGEHHGRALPGTVLALCMEPMFEALLTRDGSAVRRALGLAQDPPDWPSGWGDENVRDPSKHLMGRAIGALFAVRPRARIRSKIPSIWQNAKDEWAAYILTQFFADPDGKAARSVREHPIARRLAHILPP